ncbi:tyrosine-type recombinase/integrase [Dehalococcoidia bacterium]|nr:tyrosine-type recombinase/integrase [Dehalococcoidia bacterium]
MIIGLDKRANLKSLRHSFATVLIERGVAMEIVRDLMGHSSIMTTASHYTHVRPLVRNDAMSVF